MGALQNYFNKVQGNYNFARGGGTNARIASGAYAGKQILDDVLYGGRQVLNSPVVKSAGTVAKVGGRYGLPVLGAALGYADDRSQGEGEARAITSNAVGAGAGTAGAIIGGTLGSVVPVVGTAIGTIAGGYLGNVAGNFLTDRVWEATTDDDGLDKNHPRYQEHKQYLAKYRVEEYNKNPTPENKVKAETAIASANNVPYLPTTAEAAGNVLNQYRQLTKELENAYGPNSANHQAWRTQSKQDSIFDEEQSYRVKDRELRNSMIAGAFDHRNAMASKSSDNYWNDRNSSRNFIASLWR